MAQVFAIIFTFGFLGWIIFLSITAWRNGYRDLLLVVLPVTIGAFPLSLGLNNLLGINSGFFPILSLILVIIVNILAWQKIKHPFAPAVECPQCKKSSKFNKIVYLDQETKKRIPSKLIGKFSLGAAIIFFMIGVFLFTQSFFREGGFAVVLGFSAFGVYSSTVKPSIQYLEYECVDCGKKTHTTQQLIEMPDNTLISIRNLKVWFELKKWGFRHAGYVRAVDGVSFDLKKDETIAIVGESGSGKTSLMRTILQLNRPTDGQVIFEGRVINDLKAEDLKNYRSQVGYVQQDPYGAMPPFMNVQTILEEPLKINGVKDPEERLQRVSKVLEEVKISPVAEFLPKFPHQLSGGQQQRVVIARAMIMNPKLLVADEPVSMLDASVRVEILKLLSNLQEEHNLGVIYITHDLSTVRYFSERIFVMYAGKIVEMRDVQKLIDDPRHPYTMALLEGTSDPDAENATKQKQIPPGEPPSLVNPPDGCHFHPRCPRMIAGLCNTEEPPEFKLETEGMVACWLYK